MKTALLVGGTAATGVAIAAELGARGYEVTIYHRGTHEVASLGDLEHIHGDPHFRESIAADLAGRQWDITVATYGRTRYLAAELGGRTGHFLMVGGIPAVKPVAGVPMREDDPYAEPADAPAAIADLIPSIVKTERTVLAAGEAGAFNATVVRYPYVYGPHSVVPMEWHVVKRVMDGRQRWALRGAGLQLQGRCASANAARLIALALEQPDVSSGEIFHAADERQYSFREWIEMVATAAGGEFEFVDVPPAMVPLGSSALPMDAEFAFTLAADEHLRHSVVSSEKARRLLGYEDAVSPVEWIARTVEFWLAYPPRVDGSGGRLMPEEFDYAAEDLMLAHYDAAVAAAPPAGVPLARGHAYEHPKAPTTST